MRAAGGWRRWVREALVEALRAAFPPRCLGCRRLMGPAARTAGAEEAVGTEPADRLAAFFCSDCRRGVVPVDSPLCPRCGVMFKGRVGADHLCGRCLEEPPPFFMARAACVYDRSVVDVLQAFKYQGRLQLATALGPMLRETYLRYWRTEPVEALLPIPLHRRRLRARGFNPPDLLLRRWGRAPDGLRIPPVLRGALRRVKPTASQTGLGRRERRANVRGAFAVSRPEVVAGRHLLLVDDVVTTGATAAEAARVLIESGAARVDVLALARAL